MKGSHLEIVSLISIVILIILTAFFVASEFAIVKIRESRVDQLVEEGKAGAKSVKQLITHLDEYLSACQLGITITALGIGWLGERGIKVITDPILALFGLDVGMSKILSIIISFSVITFLHVVVGEMAPKTIAIQKAEFIAIICAKPLIVFYRMLYPLIWLLNGSSRLILKLFGLKAVTEHHSSLSEDELRIILSNSYKNGEINQAELTYVNNIFNFDNRIASEVMTPRTEMITLSAEDTFQDLLHITKEYKYTRYPVYEEDKDDIIGIVNIKDILIAQINEKIDPTEKITSHLKPIIRIIHTVPIHDLLLKMQSERTHMAVLIDEYGGTAGLVTVEDIIEEIVGEIQDEFDADEVIEVTKIEENHYIFSGKYLIEELNTLLGTNLSDAEVNTIGGWILSQNFEIKLGESLYEDGFTFTVKEMDGHQIQLIEVKLENDDEINKNLT